MRSWCPSFFMPLLSAPLYPLLCPVKRYSRYSAFPFFRAFCSLPSLVSVLSVMQSLYTFYDLYRDWLVVILIDKFGNLYIDLFFITHCTFHSYIHMLASQGLGSLFPETTTTLDHDCFSATAALSRDLLAVKYSFLPFLHFEPLIPMVYFLGNFTQFIILLYFSEFHSRIVHFLCFEMCSWCSFQIYDLQGFLDF